MDSKHLAYVHKGFDNQTNEDCWKISVRNSETLSVKWSTICRSKCSNRDRLYISGNFAWFNLIRTARDKENFALPTGDFALLYSISVKGCIIQELWIYQLDNGDVSFKLENLSSALIQVQWTEYFLFPILSWYPIWFIFTPGVFNPRLLRDDLKTIDEGAMCFQFTI